MNKKGKSIVDIFDRKQWWQLTGWKQTLAPNQFFKMLILNHIFEIYLQNELLILLLKLGENKQQAYEKKL